MSARSWPMFLSPETHRSILSDASKATKIYLGTYGGRFEAGLELASKGLLQRLDYGWLAITPSGLARLAELEAVCPDTERAPR